MIEFNDPRDLELIEKIVNYDISDCNILDLLSKSILSPGRAIILHPNTEELQLFVEKSLSIDEFLDDLIGFVSQLEHLNDKGLIYIIDNSSQMTLPVQVDVNGVVVQTPCLTNIDNFAQRIRENPLPFDVKRVKPLYLHIKKYFESFVVPRAELKELARNKFKTPEQIRFEDQRKWTWIGIGAALLIGLIGIGLNIIALCKDTNINQEQIESIKTIIQDNKTTIPTTINTKITNDTLKVDVVEATPNK